LGWRKNIFGKYFLYFSVFGVTENISQSKTFFGLTEKTYLIFVKCFPFFKSVNHFPSLKIFREAAREKENEHLLSPSLVRPQTTITDMSNRLPHDLWTEILVRLLAKSLLRFQYVSKS
jgi:hypothetical protein